jgi:hypothetical protein
VNIPAKWTIPPGTTIAPGGFLLIWADGETSWSPVDPNPGTPDYTLTTELSNGSTVSHYYRVVATRTGASASVDLDYVSDTRYGTWVRKITTTYAALNVTYTARANLAGATFHWYFTPFGGAEEDTGVTAASLTISPADCSKRGLYRVQVTNACGDSSDAVGEIRVFGCP